MFYGRSTYADKELLPTDDEGSGVETQGGEGLCYGTGHLGYMVVEQKPSQSVSGMMWVP